MQEPFKPDLARFFRSFEREYQHVPIVVERAKRCGPLSDRDALFVAMCDTRDDDAATRLKLIGAQNFYYRFSRALADAQDGIQAILEKYLGPYRDRIDPVDEIGSCNDPVLLFKIMNGGLDGSDHRLDRAAVIEAQRKLAIASQLLAIGAVDSFELVSSDLTEITFLVRRKLFEATDRRMIPLSFALDPDDANHVHAETPIVVGGELAAVTEGLIVRHQDFSCRVVVDGGRTYFVQTHSRPKSRISAVIKLERGGRLNDRRALRHVIVAVEEGSVLRAATVDDIAPFVELSRKRLWTDELVEEMDTSGPNRFRDPRYVDEKIVGRYLRKDRPELAPPVEHQVTCVRAHLNGEHATDNLNHQNYKGKVLWESVLPRWWARDWYGIDWEVERKAP